MKIIRVVLVILGVVIAIPLIVALFVEKHYAVQREIVVDRPKEEVFSYIRYLKNQDHYNAWITTDPGIDKSFKGSDGTAGFVYAWNGEKSGRGEQEIKHVAEGERIEMELRFMEPMEGVATAYMMTEAASPTQTKVTWGMQGESKYPFNFMNLFIDKVLGKDLETSLTALRKKLEMQ